MKKKQAKLISLIEDYENPFVGKQFFGHEECYEEVEKLRTYVLGLLGEDISLRKGIGRKKKVKK